MANLPLTGSQYWGAALNNYLRQLNTDMSELKIQLANFKIAAAYSGSGWVDGTYLLTNLQNNFTLISDANGNNVNVYSIEDSSNAKIEGTMVFVEGNDAKSITLDASSTTRITFSLAVNESANLHVVQTLKYSTTSKSYEVIKRDKPLAQVCEKNGFYPVYAINDNEFGFRVAINPEQEFIFAESYILLGIIQRSGATDFRFIKKTDSAYKNIYDTRRGNLESFATMTGDTGLFYVNSASGKLVLNKNVQVDYQSNGISERGDGVEVTAEGVSVDYQRPQDYKRFNGVGRRTFLISYVQDDKTDDYSLSETWNSTAINDISSLNRSYIYGFYISVGGDLFVEQSAKAHTGSTASAFAASASWNLNANSAFRNGGLVLLGACYFDSTVDDWVSLPCAINSISPAFITDRYTENTEVIRWPAMTYFANAKEVGSRDTFDKFQYRVLVPDTARSDTMLIRLDTTFSPDSNVFAMPIVPGNFYKSNKSSGSFTGLEFGTVKINTSTQDYSAEFVGAAPTCFVDGGIISTSTANRGADKKLYTDTDSIKNVLRDTALVGNLTIQNTSPVSVSGNVTGVNEFDAKTIKTTTIQGLTTDGLTLGTNANAITSSGLTLTDSGQLTLKADKIRLESTQKIEFNNSVSFTTSDRRSKKDIISLDEQTCLRAVNDLDAKQFTYTQNDLTTIGLIAQDIEELLPEYKDLLVSVTSDDELGDKRMVAESKLLFILWQAVRALIKQGGR